MSLAVGTRFGQYEVLAPLGAGGMGEVYRARDTTLDRDVALKILPAAFTEDRDRVLRFEREAKTLATLNHPHIAQIYSFDGRALAMEFVDGEDLAHILSRRRLPIDEALSVARQIADALDAAHERGIIHRDLKPGNIATTEAGVVKVLDFGLAKSFTADSSSATMTLGVVVGTPAYMSPEQARGLRVDRRTDVWAFGCVLFEMLAGERPFQGQTASDSIAAILDREPNWERLPAATPAAIRKVLRHCLAKDPKRRTRDMGDILLDLEAPFDEPRGDATPAMSRSWRRRTLVALSALVMAAAAFSAGGQWRAAGQPRPLEWHGERLGGPPVGIVPRVSPDGQTLAFQVFVDGLTQVAVMKPQTGHWAVLTRDRSRGMVVDLSWSADGTKLYYDRSFDGPRGVFSIPVLGGEERLVLDAAMSPRVLPDGSLLVVRPLGTNRRQLHRFWPDTGRLDPLPARLAAWGYQPALTVFADGREAVFLGAPLHSDEKDHLLSLDLQSGRIRRLAAALEIDTSNYWTFPLATAGNHWVLLDVPAGNLHAIVAIPRDGSAQVQRLITVTGRPLGLDISIDGSLYIDQVEQSTEVFSYSPGSGALERMPVPAVNDYAPVVPLPDGRVLIAAKVAGRDRILVLAKGKDPSPFLDTQEETTWPMSMVGDDTVAFFSGSLPNRVLTLASAADGRIIRKLPRVRAGTIFQLAGSPDGTTISYASSGAIWKISATSDGAPERVRAGDGVAFTPDGRYLVVAFSDGKAHQLVRVPLAGGIEEPIVLNSSVRLSGGSNLAPNAVAPDGRIIHRIVSADSWFWPAAVIDPRTGTVDVVPPGFNIDMNTPGWTRDGKIVMQALFMRSILWQLKPSRPPLE
jgi:eukaryotic-like serine/threonine-protein kinase